MIFFFNDTATTEIYTLSLHDALPICRKSLRRCLRRMRLTCSANIGRGFLGQHCSTPLIAVKRLQQDRKSTRLNSSHANISYAVFCLKKKKNQVQIIHTK